MQSFKLLKGENLAIDLGNNNTILLGSSLIPASFPSFVTLDMSNKSIRAVGKEAYEMVGKLNKAFKVIKPLKGGVIDDFDSASKMLKALIKRALPQRNAFSRFERVISGVPFSTTEVEKRALRDLLMLTGASKVSLLFEPIAAAIGMGINIKEPDGKMIVDIGGGITEVVVLSLSGIVNSNSLRIGGDTFDNEIQNYFRANYKLDISLNMAERIKINVGAAQEVLETTPDPYYVVGKDTISGIPKGIKVDHIEVAAILDSIITKIEDLILRTLEECPPELAGDIYQNGIFLTGGSSLLRGLRERLQGKIQLPIKCDASPFFSVTQGVFTAMNDPKSYKSVLI